MAASCRALCLPGAPSRPACLARRVRVRARLSLTRGRAAGVEEGAQPSGSGSQPLAALRTPTVGLEISRQLGGKGGGAAVLEKGGLDLGSASQTAFSAKVDNGGSDGGNGGKIFNGGSGGDGDEGDDDDYFDDGDEEVRGRAVAVPLLESLSILTRPPRPGR